MNKEEEEEAKKEVERLFKVHLWKDDELNLSRWAI